MGLSKSQLKELKENSFIRYKGYKKVATIRILIVVVLQILFTITVIKLLIK